MVLRKRTHFFAVLALLFAAAMFVADTVKAQDFEGISQCFRRGNIGECGEGAGHCDVPFMHDAEDQQSYLVNEYSRRESIVDNLKFEVTQTDGNGTVHRYGPATAQAHCLCEGEGEPGGSANPTTCQGAWSMRNPTGLCWPRHTLVSPENCAGEQLRKTYDQQNTDLDVPGPGNSLCGDGECCVVDDEGDQIAITGATGDPMMAMFDGKRAYHEFKEGCNTLYWIDRSNGAGPSYPLMIPSKCEDYRQFVKAEGGGAVDVEMACREGEISICPYSIPPVPPRPTHRGCGGCLSNYSDYDNVLCSNYRYAHNSDYNETYNSCSGRHCSGNRCVSYTNTVRTSWNSCNCGQQSSHTQPMPTCSNSCSSDADCAPPPPPL